MANKVCVLESWVRDLGEQNAVLVVTVEELEREAADRVALLEDRLNKMAATTRESCVSLRDHQIQVSSLVTDKIGLEKKAQGLGEKVLTLERKNVCLKEENVNLQSDLNNLVQPNQELNMSFVVSRRSSQSLKDGQRDYLHQLLEDHLRKDNSSMASSFSNLQDAESSMYGGRGSEKDLIIMKLRSDFRNLQSSYEETSQQLLERDKQIADLQTQLTETHHELALSQAEVNTVKHTLQEVRHRNRHESVEITRKEEVIRHLLSKQSFLKKDSMKGSSPSMGDIDTVITGENNVEAQLSENIDVLASRLADLEDECQQLRNQHTALQETHALCSPTINMLQEQLNRSHQTQVELRTVLTAEVAQRHDELVTLRDELKEQEQMHHETQMQLQLKAEVIKDLRKELRDMKDRQLTVDGKNTLTSMKDGVYNGSKETKSTEVQTSEIFSNKNISLAEETNRMSSNGFYSPASQPSQISKLENELEQKLDSSRREGSQKGERMQYLTGQLTSLQLEVGRTHGQAEQLRRQVEKKTELIEKMETENSSLTQQLNEKSSTLERFQTEILKISTDLEKRRKEVYDSSNNPLASNPSVTKSILVDNSSLQSQSELTSACMDNTSSVNSVVSTLPMSTNSCMPGAPLNGNSSPHPRSWQHSALQPLDRYNCDTENMVPDIRPTYQCAKEVLGQNASCAITPDVLSSCSGNSFLMNSSQQSNQSPCSMPSEPPKTVNGQNIWDNKSDTDSKINVDHTPTGQEDLSHAHKHDTRQTHYWKTLAEEATQKLTQAKKENETVSREKEQLLRQAQEAERRRQEVLNSLHLLQGQVQTLEEEVTAAAEARAEAERRAEDIQRNNLQLQEHLSVHEVCEGDGGGVEEEEETSESVERLGQQLEEAVAALTAAREEARNKGELLRRAQQDVDQLSDALGYEKDLNTTLHDQVATLQSQLEGLRCQVTTMEELLDEEQREVASLTDSLTQENKILQEVRIKCDRRFLGEKPSKKTFDKDSFPNKAMRKLFIKYNTPIPSSAAVERMFPMGKDVLRPKRSRMSDKHFEMLARKEAARSEEQIAALKRELQETQDKISRQDRRAREMESEREAEVAAVAERLTAMHEESVRRLEDTLLSYTRMQAHEEYQVESLEESVKELGARLADSELRVKETQKERDALGRSLQEERSRREQDAHEHQRQILRLTEETSLLKVRGRKEINEESD
ncbi:hypothetical protein Hamer_G008307 [Homarus americanus]|uniref:Uncharacterized protein n=1 Tax=Homarus americanus TaxID=6706 RepID=A0A8J5NEY7_HOMAM|nr:hypothetical protein Hamer_G008307 [Homarus americanus]